ncbi:hypothetical protein KSB07_03405 [Acinetobacter junii]|uniref:hypothetical protein n=1 Tax=Acinetobacter TaxID=469 RepID=UPI001F42EC2E|nr:MULTISPECIES: hypothetical protein [Acinetobacter]MCE6003404.1 hypothetical protein [Acinetobacter junii]
MLEKFIQYCHSKQDGLSDYYITQTYKNMQELLYVQFLEAELQTQLQLNESLEQKLSQDSQILHNIIEMETSKNQKLQYRINHVMSLFGCQMVVHPNDIIEALTGEIDQSFNVEDIQ